VGAIVAGSGEKVEKRHGACTNIALRQSEGSAAFAALSRRLRRRQCDRWL